MIDWKRVSVKKLIKKIEERMNFECIHIKNALSSQTTKFQLAPAIAEYSIPSYIWNTWSDEIQNAALEALLDGYTPFHLKYVVSKNGQIAIERFSQHLPANQENARVKESKIFLFSFVNH